MSNTLTIPEASVSELALKLNTKLLMTLLACEDFPQYMMPLVQRQIDKNIEVMALETLKRETV